MRASNVGSRLLTTPCEGGRLREGQNAKFVTGAYSPLHFYRFTPHHSSGTKRPLPSASSCTPGPGPHLKQQRGSDDYTPGGASLDVGLRKNIIHLHYDLLWTPEEIAPTIVSPRLEGGVCVTTVTRVIDFFEVHWHVEDVPRKPRRRKMVEPHVLMLISIIVETPWLFLDEIADELKTRCGGVRYLPGLCYATLSARGYSLKNMRRKARQRCENQRFLYFLAIGKLVMHPSQLVFADEVGQDGRGSRRRRWWGPVGSDVEITEFLTRGKHISILALYGYAGFVDFDFLEGGFKADDFMSAVEFMIIPHLRGLRVGYLSLL